MRGASRSAAATNSSSAMIIRLRRLPLCMVGQRGDHFRRHQRQRPGFCKEMAKASLQGVGSGALHWQADADAAVERQELIGAQTLHETAVARQHDGQQDVGIQSCRRQQA